MSRDLGKQQTVLVSFSLLGQNAWEIRSNSWGLALEIGGGECPGAHLDLSWSLCPKELPKAPSSSAQNGEVRKSLETKRLVPGNY